MAGYRRVLFILTIFAGGAFAQTTSFTISGLTLSGASNSAGQISGTGTATVSPFATGAVAVAVAGVVLTPSACGSQVTLSETFMFDSSDSLTVGETFSTVCDSPTLTATANFNVTGGTGFLHRPVAHRCRPLPDRFHGAFQRPLWQPEPDRDQNGVNSNTAILPVSN
jgi:hypothetical protein